MNIWIYHHIVCMCVRFLCSFSEVTFRGMKQKKTLLRILALALLKLMLLLHDQIQKTTEILDKKILSERMKNSLCKCIIKIK